MKSSPVYFDPSPHNAETIPADICIYGGNSGGVTAAIEASRRGLDVVLLDPSAHPGGMTSGGLGMTDIGSKFAIGGLARTFYQEVGTYYGVEEEWRFEPHVAQGVFEKWLAASSARVFRRQFLDSVEKQDERIVALHTVSGLTVRARVFIDTSYEGDLMAKAGVSFTIGRESNTQYGETLNGQQVRDKHQFDQQIDPYVSKGAPGSGVIWGIDPEAAYQQGQGDQAVQAYCFRLCLTKQENRRLPFPKPDGYDPATYELLRRFLATGWNEVFHKFDAIRNKKTDTNNHGPFSTDLIGGNHAFPNASYEERERIFQAHVCYQQGLMWTLANDAQIPQGIREEMSEWGLCADEFPEQSGWSRALYVREARRLVSDVVITEHHCTKKEEVEDPVSLAAYQMDSHNCRRLIQNGQVVNEGDVQVTVGQPYGISYRAIVPKQEQCSNLFVPFALSASHIAFGSIRMEPVFMGLSQAAAIAAAMALENKQAVQEVPYSELASELRNTGLVLEVPENYKRTRRDAWAVLEDS